jgi:hypothetical protein
VGKPEVKRPLGKLKHRCVDNIKIDLRQVGVVCNGRVPVEYSCEHVMNLRVP